MPTLEICANSFASALAAQKGGATRVELCDNMAEGGTTPSYGQIKLATEQLTIEVWPIIRPRGGDFLYTADEFAVMLEDVKLCKSLGCNGIVTGILTADGLIDRERCAKIIELAKPMSVAFHRAFDMCKDPEKELSILIDLGFVRVLTSGGAENALLGAEIIANLVKKAKDKIEIMPGAGINLHNISKIRSITQADTFHTSARTKQFSKMDHINLNAKMGSGTDEYSYEQTAVETVKQLINNLKKT